MTKFTESEIESNIIIYRFAELDEISSTEDSSVVRQEDKRQVEHKIKFYNMDAIISVGYRVSSKKGTA